MNIYFRQDRTGIVADVEFSSGRAGNIIFYFRWKAADIHLASMAAQHMQAQLDALSEKIRETSYQQGWSDAKKGKAKQKDFKFSIGYVDKDVK